MAVLTTSTNTIKQNKTELTANPLRFSISLTVQMTANEKFHAGYICIFWESVVTVTWLKRAKTKFERRQEVMSTVRRFFKTSSYPMGLSRMLLDQTRKLEI